MRNQIIQGSVLDADTWAGIPDGHVQTCITSPPYWGLRDYGVEGQLGLEKTPEEFIERMVQVFWHVKRILRDDGTLWLNLGDSYNGSGGYSGNHTPSARAGSKQTTNKGSHKMIQSDAPGLKPKDLCGIPWRVALALQADGWYLRQDIIWHKPNPMPESVRDRCTKAHEYLFLLTKKPRYFCDMEAIKEPAATDWTITQKDRVQRVDATGGAISGGMGDVISSGQTRNKRSVWTVPTAPYKEAHFATFPPKLIEPCVLAGCPAGGIVFDPFMGSGTTGMVAKQNGRDYLGIELNAEYIEMTKKRIRGVQEPLFT